MVNLKATDVYAENSIENEIYQQVTQQIDKEYPFLPDTDKKQLIEKSVTEFKKLNKDAINQGIVEKTEFFKSQFRDENNQTYLTGGDTDFYFRFVRNIINRGRAGEYERNGKTYSKLMLAPSETDVTQYEREFHVFLTVWIYKFMRFFNHDLLPIAIFFLMPAILAGVTAIPAFFIGKEISGNIGGFVTSTIIGLHGFILSRTPAGFSDTDIYNILFPLVITYLLIRGLKTEIFWKKIVYIAATSFTIAIYSTAWSRWWIMLYFALGVYFILASLDVITLFKGLNKKGFTLHNLSELSKNLRNRLILIGSLISFVILFIVAIGGKISQIISSFPEVFLFIGIKNATRTNLWPNIFTTVEELMPVDSTEILTFFGSGFNSNGYIVLILATTGLLFIVKSKGKWDYKIGLSLLLFLWVVAATYASLKGVRFLLLLAPPIAIAIGAFVGYSINWIDKAVKTLFEIKGSFLKIIASFVIISILLVPMVVQANAYNKQSVPTLNDQWMETLQEIKDNSKETAIISSWWDFGHSFITYSERGASADGGTQNSPQTYWLAKMLLSANERESVGILRMLNCDGNKAFEKINNITNDQVTSIKHLEVLVTVGKTEAEVYLKDQKFSEDQIINILESTHGNPPESFLITSEDMVSKASIWAHFGGWDFSKAEMWVAVSSGSQIEAINTFDKYENKDSTIALARLKGFTQEQADAWISGFPRYFSGLDDCTTSNVSITCKNGVVIDRNEVVNIYTKEAAVKPGKIVLFSNGKYVIQAQENGVKSVAVLLTQENTTHRAMILSPELSNSTFTKLFFLNDGGEYFTLFKDITDVKGQRILTWKVDWDKVLKEDTKLQEVQFVQE